MRTLSNTLQQAQRADVREPVIKVEYQKDGITWTDVSNDVWAIDYTLRPYGGQTTITLDNTDGAYDSFSQKGRAVRIALGLKTPMGSEYPAATYLPYVWITTWQRVSQGSQCLLNLICESLWARMERHRLQEAAGYKNWASGNSTIKTILTYILAKMGITLGTSISEDSYVGTDKPDFTIIANDSGMERVQALLQLTGCFLVPRLDTVCLKYVQESDASVATYYTVPKPGQHGCYWVNWQSDTVYKPSKVTVEYTGGATASYTDPTAIEVLEELRIANWITTEAKAIIYATMLVNRFKLERFQGEASFPLDCGLEVYDTITVMEGRLGKSVSQQRSVGSIRHLYQPGLYNTGIEFGGDIEKEIVIRDAEEIIREQQETEERERFEAERREALEQLARTGRALITPVIKVMKGLAALPPTKPGPSAFKVTPPKKLTAEEFISGGWGYGKAAPPTPGRLETAYREIIKKSVGPPPPGFVEGGIFGLLKRLKPGAHSAILTQTPSAVIPAYAGQPRDYKTEVMSEAPEIRLTEIDQTDPAGRWRLRVRDDVLYFERAKTVNWATSYSPIFLTIASGVPTVNLRDIGGAISVDLVMGHPFYPTTIRPWATAANTYTPAPIIQFKGYNTSALDNVLAICNRKGTAVALLQCCALDKNVPLYGLKQDGESLMAMLRLNANDQIQVDRQAYLYFYPATELTISAGAVTWAKGHHTIDTEGDAAADDLDTINGGYEGLFLVIRAAHADRTVVVKHGTGNIKLRGAADISLDDTDKAILLFHNGTNWVDL